MHLALPDTIITYAANLWEQEGPPNGCCEYKQIEYQTK